MRHRATSGGDPNCRHYKPGDAGFDAIAADVTPLDKIRNPRPASIMIWAEEGPKRKYRRNGTVDKL